MEKLLPPVGRLVQGSLYKPNTTDLDGNPLVYRSGANKGQARVDYFFSLAIPKNGESHWRETTWGQIIWSEGVKSFPQGQTNFPNFAWKIIDGDSQAPSTQGKNLGKRPCDYEGFPGNWVLKFGGGIAPTLVNADASEHLVEQDAINLGDYVEVCGTVSGNESLQQPGIYLNHRIIALRAIGKRIVTGIDPKSVGFGKSPLPPGVSSIPSAQAFAAPAPSIVPYPAILTPPAPAVVAAPIAPPAQKVMTPAAQGATYEQMTAAGWTDALLFQHGMMISN